LVKNSRQIEKHLRHFQKDNLIIQTKGFQKNQINYQDYLSFSNKVLEFLVQKENKMTEEFKVVHKFQKLINSFGQQAGILANIQTIDNYYEIIAQESVGQKQRLAIQLGNGIILQMYLAYQELLLKFMGQDPILKEKLTNVFALDQINETKLFDASLNLKILFKFVNMVYNSQKISKKEFNIIYFNTIYLSGYLSRFSNLYNYFILQLKY
jgi:hypothetical protein